jgi:alkanesulfonate monooxygenase SsuD/methylene tetrahydromethanopterin reductase-like flavin-dependent oxidoreductase (luciferase family)
MAEYRRAAFVGTGAQVAERIHELATRLKVQEIAVVTWAADELARQHSYRLLAQAMGFAPAPSACQCEPVGEVTKTPASGSA